MGIAHVQPGNGHDLLKGILTPDIARTFFADLPKQDASIDIASALLDGARIVFAIVDRPPEIGDYVATLNPLTGRLEPRRYSPVMRDNPLTYIVCGVIASATVKLLRS